MTSYVYREAQVANTTGHVLLTGPISTYVDGSFVGHGTFEDTAIGEQMLIGLGVNSDMRAHRELIDREDRVQGGNRAVDFTYRLTLENFSEETSLVRVKDRIPLAMPDEIKLTIIDDGTTDAPTINDHSSDPAQGMLSWNLSVPAGATGSNATSVTYTIRLEYDRQMTLTSANQ